MTTEQQPINARPIILRTWEVRGLLDGTVAQLWRAMEAGVYRRAYHPYDGDLDDDGWPMACSVVSGCLTRVECPWGGKGDKVWGRETWGIVDTLNNIRIYRADIDPDDPTEHLKWLDRVWRHWRSSVTMPRCYSRILLEIEAVSAVPVQGVTEADAKAAGADGLLLRQRPDLHFEHVPLTFQALWDADNPRHPWSSNPMTWRLVVRRVES